MQLSDKHIIAYIKRNCNTAQSKYIMNEIRVAILGFGGIAQSHKHGYDILKQEGFPVKLVAICDIDESRFYTAQEINLGTVAHGDLDGISLYTDLDQMLANEEIDIVDVCLPTYLHKEYTVKLLRAGKNVQCEKPMSLSYTDCEEMLAVAKECGKKIMIGQCLHFHESYDYLRACVHDGRFGRLRNISLERLSALPAWGYDGWYRDINRSGGAPFDLHIHDIDIINYILGKPDAISSVTVDAEMPHQYVNTRLFYGEVTVFVTASFNESASADFKMSFRARFDDASLVFEGGSVTVFPNEKGALSYEAEGTRNGERKDYMAQEIRTMAHYVADPNFVNEINTPEGAASSIFLIEKIIESASHNGEIIKL